jgi:hypothetical protein
LPLALAGGNLWKFYSACKIKPSLSHLRFAFFASALCGLCGLCGCCFSLTEKTAKIAKFFRKGREALRDEKTRASGKSGWNLFCAIPALGLQADEQCENILNPNYTAIKPFCFLPGPS